MNVSVISADEVLVAKQPLISVLSRQGASGSGNVTIPSSASGWAASTMVIDAVSCSNFTTDASGNLAVSIDSGMPRVLIADSMKGAVCSNMDTTTPSSSSKSSKSGAGRMVVGCGAVVAGVVGAVVMGF